MSRSFRHRQHREPWPARTVGDPSTRSRRQRRAVDRRSAASASTPTVQHHAGLTMLFGRFFMIILLLAIAGYRRAEQFRRRPAPSRHDAAVLSAADHVIVIVGALTFFPR
ncbi:MAG: potassium-transporting ATPase subunit KdpA [Vicinamibacterales bacterium]